MNIHKLMILGLYNESRGKDSCGYYFNGNIMKGVDKDAHFSDFLAEAGLVPGDLKTKIFMGHTRKATGGTHSFKNAHPHVVNDNYVQTHNGVINNVWSLGTKYKVDTKSIYVDSEALAHLIAQQGPKEILEEYTGYAALAFTYMLNPECLYLYHGASRDEVDDEFPFIERPLYVLSQPEGLYYSSMPEALRAINTIPGETEPLTLTCNHVYEVANGEFTGAAIAIDRANKNVKPPKVHQSNSALYSACYPNATKSSAKESAQILLPSATENEPDLIIDETVPTGVLINDIVYWRGRYHKGVIMEGGRALHLLNGKVLIDRTDCTVSMEKAADNYHVHEYYFLNGIMLDSKESYEALKLNKIDPNTEAGFRQLSMKSKYPIIQIQDTRGIGSTRWIHKGEIVKKETFRPKFCRKGYKIKNGRTKQIVPNSNYVH